MSDDGRSGRNIQKKGDNSMTEVKEKRNVIDQIEDLKEVAPMIKELPMDEKLVASIFIDGMRAATKMFRSDYSKTA